MPRITKDNAKELGARGGKKSKRRPSIIKALEKMLLDSKNKKVTEKIMATAIYGQFLKGNGVAITQILNRLDGVVTEKTIIIDDREVEEKKREMEDFVKSQMRKSKPASKKKAVKKKASKKK